MSGGKTRDGDEAAEASCLRRAGSWPVRASTARLLLIVASDRVRALMRALLEGEGYDVVSVPGDAVPAIKDVDLALVDLADQPELSPRLAEALAEMPVLATTSLPSQLLTAGIGLHDPSAWLTKPFSPVVLLRQVERLLTRPTS